MQPGGDRVRPMSLKARNLPYVSAFLIFNILLVLNLTYPKLHLTALTALVGGGSDIEKWVSKGGLCVLATLVCLLLNGLIPSEWKARLVFLRWKNALPAHRAFSEYAPKDSRVDLMRLQGRHGQLPTVPREQNALWYRMLKKHETQSAVGGNHQMFLLFRDLAALSLLLMLATSGTLFLGGSSRSVLIAEVVIFLELVLLWVAAANAGRRLVVNVLAAESASA